MGWKKTRGRDYPKIRDFLLEYEWCCTALSSRIITPGSINLPPWCSLLHYDNRGTVGGLLLHTPRGVTLPVLPVPELYNPGDHIDLSCHIKSLGKVFSVMGLKGAVIYIENMIKQEKRTSVDYFIMRKQDYLLQKPVFPRDIQFHRAGAGDVPSLFPLQQAYELEEVVLSPEDYNPSASLNQFRKNVKKHYIYFLQWKNDIIAKAGTNALGIQYYQIGGVYTT